MEPNRLPLWLLGIQAVTWLATRDATLTSQARPNATPHKLGGHPFAIPIEGWKPLTRRIKNEGRGIRRQYREYTGANPPKIEGEALPPSKHTQLAGEISGWAGGFSLATWPSILGLGQIRISDN